jgi:hypothetical protein
MSVRLTPEERITELEAQAEHSQQVYDEATALTDVLSGAAKSAAASIRDYLSGEWDGAPGGWAAVLERLDAAIAQAEGVDAE